jgi:glyoxylase-like metal-dependent hydrolase (beta-lactamase superfamily II)
VTEFKEVGERVWVARYDWFDVNVGLILGSEGLVVVDTNATPALGRDVLEAVRRITSAPVRAVVNTHVHFDHTFGNSAFVAEGAGLIAHESVAEELPGHAAEVRAAAAEDPDPRTDDLAGVTEVLPSRTFSSALTVDLGDRVVELIHPGRGHAAGDIVLRVPDADVVFAGDLVEESAARSAVPGFGSDCYPMDWPATLDLVLQLTGAGTRIVPGHGAPVDQDFVHEQRSALGVVAETIRDLVTRGVPQVQALEAADWPYPREELENAVRRGYEQLPGVRRQLPLI